VTEVKLLKDRFEHALNIIQNVVIPETDDVIPALFQRSRSLCVQPGSFVVLATVNLDHQFSFGRHKVDDISCKRNLPPEFNATELTRAKSRPKETLGISRTPAELAGIFSQRLSPLTQPSPHPKSDISDFGPHKMPNSGKPEFGWGEGHIS
jgi:hypothetical protein